MTIFTTVGSIWIIFTSSLGTIAIIYGAYKHYQRVLAHAHEAESVRELVR